jgi:Ca2+-binding RTX toxin-like protein
MKKPAMLLATTGLLLTLALPSVAGAKTPDPKACAPGSSGECHDGIFVWHCKPDAFDCRGTKDDDRMIGTPGHDVIRASRGWDAIKGKEGNDTGYGGFGRDYIYGETGMDSLHGGDGSDHIYGGSGKDSIYGGSGRDSIYGGQHDDVIFAGVDGADIDCGGGTDKVFYTDPAGTMARNCETIIRGR